MKILSNGYENIAMRCEDCDSCWSYSDCSNNSCDSSWACPPYSNED